MRKYNCGNIPTKLAKKMEITLLVTGKTVSRELASLTADYAARASRYTPFEMKVLPDVRNARALTPEQRKSAEGKQLLAAVSSSDFLMLLDERGRQYSSMDFAAMLQKRMASGMKRLVFAVGGPYGFSFDVYERADGKISLSAMTFSHEMVRLFFAEQIYRAMTILRGDPYHHE